MEHSIEVGACQCHYSAHLIAFHSSILNIVELERSESSNMSRTDQQLRALFPRFRILIMGRRNSGKTTILRKMVGSEDGALEIRDEKGRLAEACLSLYVRFVTLTAKKVSDALTPTIDVRAFRKYYVWCIIGTYSVVWATSNMRSPTRAILALSSTIRGVSRPQDLMQAPSFELTMSGISSSRGLVWSTLRTSCTQYGKYLTFSLYSNDHGSRFCIPSDEERAPSDDFELRFFERGTFPGMVPSSDRISLFWSFIVPVVAIFTKWEAFLDRESDRLDIEPDDEELYDKAILKFQETLVMELRKTAHPPSDIVHVQSQWNVIFH